MGLAVQMHRLEGYIIILRMNNMHDAGYANLAAARLAAQGTVKKVDDEVDDMAQASERDLEILDWLRMDQVSQQSSMCRSRYDECYVQMVHSTRGFPAWRT